MKTIEEAAIEYSERSEDKFSNSAKVYDKFDIEDAFSEGVEFAQRWIPVEEENTPEEEFGFYKPVLVLNEKYGMCSSAAYKNGKFIPDNPVIEENEITHWRPIELK